jgi:xanthine dehydrogenase molybdopterin-binding subunit B
MEFLLTEVSNGLMHKLKEFERSVFQMPMEIDRVKIGSSSGNHGTATKPMSASSGGNCTEGFKEETEILAEAR